MFNNAKSKEVENIINKHAKLAKKIALKYQRDHLSMKLDLEELHSAALLGLVDAARRYDPVKQSNFCTYAFYRIHGAIKDYVRLELRQRGYEGSLHQEPHSNSGQKALVLDRLENQVDFTAMSYGQDLNDLGSLIYMLTDLNIKIYLSKGQKEAQISYLSDDDPEEMICLRNSLAYLKKLIAKLPRDQQKLLKLYYVDGYSFHEMTDAFDGLSLSWISRQHNAALEQLRLEVSRGDGNV
ncbi:MAG: sigma-70 family RNA polymerase sigma factor [Deltaproteobacteria bacterium]|nr:sigma-70 family RNA polymerase sigma factor [Deltaproteobacteria bacterium]